MANDISLAQILEFHRDLRWLSSAGLHFNLDGDDRFIDGSTDSLARKLAEIETQLAGHESIAQTIESDLALPQRYRMAIKTWILSSDRTVALNILARTKSIDQDIGDRMGQAIRYPFVVGVLTYLALMLLCYVTVPVLESIYHQIGRPLNPAVALVVLVRHWLPVWAIGLPALLVAGVVLWRTYLSRWSWPGFPGINRLHVALRRAELADHLATLIEHGATPDQSVATVTRMSESIAGSPEVLPPLLGWAIHSDLGHQRRAEAVRIVASTYRWIATQQARHWQATTASIVCVALAGLFVFGYGFTLFLAMRDLLIDVSIPGGH